MLKIRLWALALAGASLVPNFARAQFADSVVSYNSGTGFAAGFTNASAALGAPASGSGVTPFAPPFAKTQLVSIGAGGEITLQFNTPIMNNPADPYGVNFILFANEFFVSSGGNVSGLFSHAASTSALIQVSPDGSTWYTLNPALAPAPGNLFPTDGSGNPLIPVNPALPLSAFTGANLAGIQALYAGSAGGTGYDLGWAEDSGGNSVNLPDADYLRIEVQTGVLDLDAVSETGPVPEAISTMGMLALAGAGLFWRLRRTEKWVERFVGGLFFLALLGSFAASNLTAETITESFTNNPANDGWRIYGDTNLFTWDSTNHDLIVTWDSSQPNSYFYHPLANVLGQQDTFSLEFDIQLTNVVASGDEIAIGFFNFEDATNASFLRDSVNQSPNLVEFDYFPLAFGYQDIAGSMTDTNGLFTFVYDDSAETGLLATNVIYHVMLEHTAGEAIISVNVYTYDSGDQLQLYSDLPETYIEAGFGDFFLDAISISSYGDSPDDGSIFAQGTIGNLVVTTTPRPIGNLTGGFNGAAWQVQFTSRTNWTYTLERSSDLKSWTPVLPVVNGTGAALALQDTNPPAGTALYRVLAQP